MAPEPELEANYFEYFKAIEDHYRYVRGRGMYLASPSDWAAIEECKRLGVPLEFVLVNITPARVRRMGLFDILAAVLRGYRPGRPA